MRTRHTGLMFALFGGLFCAAALPVAALPAPQAASQPKPAANLLVGSLTAIDGRSLTVKSDAGVSTSVTVADKARILQTQPGAKTVAGATPIQLTDLAVGDRVLLAIHPAPDGATPMATTVVMMKQADIAKKQMEDQEAWREHGAGGIVKAVDLSAGTLTVAAQKRTFTIHTTPKTIIRRYSPTSIQYADAKLSTLDQIHPGDQVRVLGDRSPDGDIAAEKLVAGSFRNIAGTVVSVSAAAKTVTVMDAVTKKPVVIQITSDSQMHRLPDRMAEFLAARFQGKGAPKNGAGSSQAHPQPAPAQSPQAAPAAGAHLSLAQMLQRTPVIQLSDLHKGDALMIVASQGTPEAATAYTLLAGVGPILRASPSGNGSMFSASWNLGGQNSGAQGAGDSAGGAPAGGR